MYHNTKPVVFFTERRHTIISDVHKGLGHNPNGFALWKGFNDTKDFKQIFLAQYQRRCRKSY